MGRRLDRGRASDLPQEQLVAVSGGPSQPGKQNGREREGEQESPGFGGPGLTSMATNRHGATHVPIVADIRAPGKSSNHQRRRADETQALEGG